RRGAQTAGRPRPLGGRAHATPQRPRAADGARRAASPGELDAIGPEVHTNDDAALEPDELGDELADDAETDDGDGVPEADVGDAHRVEGDAAERREARVLERNRLGHPRHE